MRKGLGLDAEVDLLNRQQIRIGAAFFPGRDEDLDVQVFVPTGKEGSAYTNLLTIQQIDLGI